MVCLCIVKAAGLPLQDLHPQPHDGTLWDMTQQARRYQAVLKDFNQNLEQDLILYLETSDETKKRVSLFLCWSMPELRLHPYIPT